VTNTPERLEGLREILDSLQGDDNALIRTAVRLALNELDLADLTADPNPHLAQVARILDAVLEPDDGGSQ
jgi:hypothetical protein